MRMGWQQAELPSSHLPCLHLGFPFAQLAVYRHSEGHEWVCRCGKVFVVVSSAGQNKKLVPRDR
jgi:hypothetical protein